MILGTTLVTWIEPIFDRTQEDAQRLVALNVKGWHNMTADEKTEWTGLTKGALNTSDFDRVENDIHFLSDRLSLGLTTYEGNIPWCKTTAYIDNLKANLTAIRSTPYAKHDTPQVPTEPMSGFNWNDVERILYDVYDTLFSIAELHMTESEYTMGEAIGLLI